MTISDGPVFASCAVTVELRQMSALRSESPPTWPVHGLASPTLLVGGCLNGEEKPLLPPCCLPAPLWAQPSARSAGCHVIACMGFWASAPHYPSCNGSSGYGFPCVKRPCSGALGEAGQAGPITRKCAHGGEARNQVGTGSDTRFGPLWQVA